MTLGAAGCGTLSTPLRTAEPAVPALVLRPAPDCGPPATCDRGARLTILLVNPNGFSTADSVLVSLEPLRERRRWPGSTRGTGERRVRRAWFRDLDAAGRLGAAFDLVRAGEYDVRVERTGREAALWRVVLAPACWSRLEILVGSTAPPGGVAPSSATLYSCGTRRQ